MDGNFEIRDFPLFTILKSFDDIGDISNYEDTFLSTLHGEDITSHLVRAISFDTTGYKGSKICIVKKATAERKDSRGVFLESAKCMYTTVISEDDASLEKKIFFTVHKWAKEHGIESKGIAYCFSPFILLKENRRQEFCEIWIPIK